MGLRRPLTARHDSRLYLVDHRGNDLDRHGTVRDAIGAADRDFARATAERDAWSDRPASLADRAALLDELCMT